MVKRLNRSLQHLPFFAAMSSLLLCCYLLSLELLSPTGTGVGAGTQAPAEGHHSDLWSPISVEPSTPINNPLIYPLKTLFSFPLGGGSRTVLLNPVKCLTFKQTNLPLFHWGKSRSSSSRYLSRFHSQKCSSMSTAATSFPRVAEGEASSCCLRPAQPPAAPILLPGAWLDQTCCVFSSSLFLSAHSSHSLSRRWSECHYKGA